MERNVVIPRFRDEHKRDTVLIFPGGGYAWTSPREGEPVVAKFHALGMHAAIVEYRHERKIHPDCVREAVALADAFRHDQRIARLFVLGFSAGGHLALHLAETAPAWFAGAILCYPVVTADPRHRHRDSIENLLGTDRSDARLEAVSLEKHVPAAMAPVFLWHTLDDAAVPVENSLLLIAALKEQHVPCEAHLYPHGRHGLALGDTTTPFANEDPAVFAAENRHVSAWFEALALWLKSL